MNRFATLFRRSSDSPAERQARIEQEFPRVLAQSALHGWKPDASLACAPHRLVIGVATYAGPDMRLLDCVEQAVIDQEVGELAAAHAEARASSAGPSESRPSLHVDVFSTPDRL